MTGVAPTYIAAISPGRRRHKGPANRITCIIINNRIPGRFH